MSVAPSHSTTDAMDNELRIFLLKELDVKLDFVNSIEPVIGCVQNVNDLYDIGNWDMLDLMDGCMLNLPIHGLDESWIQDNVDSFRRIYAFVQYVDEQLCPPDDQGVHPDLTMTVLQRFDSKNFRKLFMKTGGRFHSKFHKAWKLFTAELRTQRETNPRYLVPSPEQASERASDDAVDDGASERGYGDNKKPPPYEEDFVENEEYDRDPRSERGYADAHQFARNANMPSASDRLRNPGGSYTSERTEPLRLKKHAALNRKIVFDGKSDEDAWAQFVTLIFGHLSSEDCAYLIHTEFLQEYREHGHDAIKSYLDPFTGRVLDKCLAQYQVDIQHLYSILNQAFRGNGGASMHTQNHKRMQDGVKVWIDALDAYGDGGNMETARAKHRMLIQQPYYKGFPGGLTGYCNQYQSAFSRLMELKVVHDDDAMKEILYHNLRGYEPGAILIRTCEIDPKVNSFRDACKYLITQDKTRSYYAQDNANRKARFAASNLRFNTTSDRQSESENHHVLAQFFKAVNDPTNSHDMSIFAAQTEEWQKYYLDKTDFDTMSPRAKDTFLVMKNLLLGRPPPRPRRGSTKPAPTETPNPPVSTTTVPRQYGDPTERQAHLATNANASHDSDASSDTDGEFGADDEFAKRLYAFHTHPDKNRDIGTFMNITMPVTPKYVKAFLTLPTNAEHLGVADDGAMSHVLGKVWQVQADTGRRVNLIGADQLTFRKNNLSVVSAIAKAYPATGPPVILLAHESPLNPDADFTLLSEYQLRDNGCLLDSVSKKHKTVQGGYGTQSFYPSGDTDGPLLPLVLRQALLTFRLEPVEEGDCERYQIIEISADRPWCPEVHNDDDGVYVRPIVSNETLTYQPMATNFVSAAIDGSLPFVPQVPAATTVLPGNVAEIHKTQGYKSSIQKKKAEHEPQAPTAAEQPKPPVWIIRTNKGYRSVVETVEETHHDTTILNATTTPAPDDVSSSSSESSFHERRWFEYLEDSDDDDDSDDDLPHLLARYYTNQEDSDDDVSCDGSSLPRLVNAAAISHDEDSSVYSDMPALCARHQHKPVGPSEQQENLYSDTFSTSSDDDEDGGDKSLPNRRSKRRRGRKKPRNKHKRAPQEPEGHVMTALSGNTVANTVGVFGNVPTTCMPDVSDDHVPPHADEPDDLYYFDASDKEKIVLGRAVHLNINYTQFLRESDVDALLTRQTDDELYGRNQEFDSYAYALQSAKTKLRDKSSPTHDDDDDLDEFSDAMEELDEFSDALDEIPTMPESRDQSAHYRAVQPKIDNLALERLRLCLAMLPLATVKQTLAHTTQMAKAILTFPMRRHFRPRFPFLNRIRLHEKVATDTYFANCAAFGGATCAQVFWGMTSHMINVYGMKTENEAPEAYADFLRHEGAPTILRRDNAQAQTGKRFTAMNREYIIGDEMTEPYHAQQNPAELRAIKWLKSHSQVIMDRRGAPPKTWLLCSEYLADVHNIASDESLRWQVPFTIRHGETPDISALLHYQFYEKIYYLDPGETFPLSKEKPGYWVGVAKNVGDALTYKILTDDTEQVIHRSVIRTAESSKQRETSRTNRRVRFDPELDPEVHHDDDEPPRLQLGDTRLPMQRRATTYRRSIKKKQRRRANRRPTTQPTDVVNNDPPATGEDTLPTDDVEVATGEDTLPTAGVEVDDEVEATQDGELMDDDRVDRATPAERRPTTTQSVRRSRRNKNPVTRMTLLALGLLGSCTMAPFSNYEFLSLTPMEPATTQSQVFIDTTPGHQTTLGPLTPGERAQLRYVQQLDALEEGVHEWSPIAITAHKVRVPKTTDRHVKVKVVYLNGEKAWQRMDAVRLQDPMIMVHYVAQKTLWKNPDFDWAMEYADADKSFRAMMARTASKINYKFGIQVPQGTRNALRLDRQHGNTLWQDAIATELKQINEYETFRVIDDDFELDPEYQQIPYHLVFDVKFDLRHKARLVGGGNTTAAPKEDVYSGVIAMDTIRLAMQVAKMNSLDMCAADVGNAFLYAKTREKVYVIAGPEFGPLQGKRLIIDKALYGLRTASARFHEHLSEKLRRMGFTPSKTDTNLWIRDAGDTYDMIGTYVDDLLVWSKDPMAIITEVKKDYILKGVGEPEYYLGGDIETCDEHWEKEGVTTALSAKTYIKNVLEKMEHLFGGAFATWDTPMAQDLHPELDDSPFLNSGEASKFRTLIGSANWMITLGRFDIHYAIQALSRFNMAPRQGHLLAMKRVFGYLKKRPKGRLLCDTSYPDHSKYDSNLKHDWEEFYPDAQEELPDRMPMPKGKPARITCYVDADHAHDKLTRRSVTGVILMVNNMPIRWISRRQKTVETSTYGSEMIAARVATELIIEVRYALRMIGVPIEGPALMLGDNMSVVISTTIPSSVLKKKHLACGYHRVREAIAAGILRFAHIPSAENAADILTKPTAKHIFYPLVKKMLFRVPVNFKEPLIPCVNENTTDKGE